MSDPTRPVDAAPEAADPPPGVSRRGLLAGAAALTVGAGVAAATGAEAGGPPHPTATHPAAHRAATKKAAPKVPHVDVVVVGAGFAGLTTARRLVQHGKSVMVLEARTRVGGRAYNDHLDRTHVADMGATFIGPTQTRIAALAKEMKVGTFPTYDDGNNVYYSQGQRSTYSDTSPLGTAPLDPTLLPDIVALSQLLDQMAQEVPVDRPWDAPHAAEWDRMTADTWIREHTANPQINAIASALFEALIGAEARQPSLLFVVSYIARATDGSSYGTLERLINTRGGAQQTRIDGGTQEIAIRVATSLGKRVVLGAPVRRIVQDRTGVTVYADHHEVRAKQVVVAVPPTLAARIDYAPLLPPARDQLTQRFSQGQLIKADAVYARPFWRDAGLTGTVVSDTGPAKTTFDASPRDGSLGVMLSFVGGDEARKYSGRPAALKAAVLDNLVTYFGSAAAHPRSFVIQDWSLEPWTRGCPTAVASPGLLTELGPEITAPVGRIHWAGTETATYWQGYMDGAVRSGERAAADVLARL